MFGRDELSILVQENNDMLAKVNMADRKYIWYIINTLGLAEVPVFKIELVRKSLLSLALLAKEEQVSLVDKLKVSKEAYCNGIIQSSIKRSLLEYFVLLIGSYMMFQYIFLLFGVFTTHTGSTGINYAFVIQFIAWIPIVMIFKRIIVNQALTSKRKKINLRSFDSLTFGIIIYILLISFFPATKEICISMTPIFALSAFLIINSIIICFSKKYWRLENEKYNSDLIKK